jgi:Fibronectin type III domain
MNARWSRRTLSAGARTSHARSSRRTARNWVSLLASLALVAGGFASFGSGPASAATTTTVVGSGDVYPGNPSGIWAQEPTSTTGTFGFVSGPATPPSGVGSLSMTIASSQHEWLNNYEFGACQGGIATCVGSPALPASWQPLAPIDTLKFSVNRTSGGTYPSYNIETDYIGDGSSYTTFVFVPSGPFTNGTWQTWDATNPADGTWYSTANTGIAPFDCNFQAAGCNASWAEIETAYPDARVKYGLGPNVGSGGTFTGNVDNFTFGSSSGTVHVYNFEPDCTTNCYVNAATGNDFNTGESGDPLQTIQAGVTKTTAGGTVHVAAGTYNESVAVNKALKLVGANAGIAGTAARGSESLVTRTSGQAGSAFSISTANLVTIDGFEVQFAGTAAVGGVVFSTTSGNLLAFSHNVVDNSTYTNDLLNVTQSSAQVWQSNLFTSLHQTGSGGTGVIAAWGAPPAGSLAALSITGNTFSHLTDNDGVPALNLSTVSGIVSSNTFDDIHQYGILLADKLGGLSIRGNVFNNIHNDTPGSSDSRGSGVRTFSVPNFVGSVSITQNTFSNSYHGVRVANDGSPADISSGYLTVNRNAITGNTAAGISVAAGTSGTLDGTCNWWGQASGPAGGQVSGSVATAPFLASSDLNGACPAPPPPPTPPSAPGAPRHVNAIPGNHKAIVRWLPPLSSGSAAISSYVLKARANGVVQKKLTLGPTANMTVVSGLSNGVSYKFRVVARNAIGAGKAAQTQSGITVGAPGAPTRPEATHPASRTLKLTFNAPANNGARITRYSALCVASNARAVVKSGSTRTLTVKGLTAGKRYGCRVTATNKRGTGPVSAQSKAVTA